MLLCLQKIRSHKIIIELLSFFVLYPFRNRILVQDLTLSLPELHICLVYLLVVALNWPPRNLMRIVVAFAVLNHRVLRLVKLAAQFVAVLQDLEVRLSDRLSVNVLFSDLWLQSHRLDRCYLVLWARS